MKDNFDLRAYLAENKMTENSRGDVRHHLGETKLDTRMFAAGHKHILTEGFAGPDDHGYSEFEDWYADHAEEFPSRDEAYRYWESNEYGQDGFDQPVDECGDNMILGRDGNFGLEEAGYDLSDDDDDDDLAGVPDLADIIGNDSSAKRAAKAAQRDIDRDVRAAEKDDAAVAAADAPAGPEDSADDPGSVPDAPADDASADYQPGISANLKYNPELVQFEMSPEELDQYLSSFRRPEAAVRYLNQKLKVFQQEVNDGTRQKAYMYLRNGDSSYQWSYTRPTMDQGEVIATIYKDPNYKGWED